jgi:hypothetical protein
MAVARAAWWNPRVRRILKAAPMVVLFLLLNNRSVGAAACILNPSPDQTPTARTIDGSANSLRAAIQTANKSPQDCTINLQAGTYTLTIRNANGQDNTASTGDLDITNRGHTVTIQGKSAAKSIVNGNDIDDRVFHVLNGANAVFSNMTIEGGVAHDDGTAGAKPGTTVAEGGGVLVQGGGIVSFSQVALKGNKAVGGSGGSGTPKIDNGQPGKNGEGGGLFLSTGKVMLTSSTVSGNLAMGGMGGNGFPPKACIPIGSGLSCNGKSGPGGGGGDGAGGGLYISGNVVLINSTLSDNMAKGGGGGAGTGAVGGTIDLCCKIGGEGGSAQGAGMYLAKGGVNVEHNIDVSGTTVSTNMASGGAGGFGGNTRLATATGGAAQGAGILVADGNVSARNSTFFGNAAHSGQGGLSRFNGVGQAGGAAGGGLYLESGAVTLTGVTLASNQTLPPLAQSSLLTRMGISRGGGIDNTGAGLFINTTLIGNNRQSSGDLINGNDVFGPITSSYSLIGQKAGAAITDEGGNTFDIDPMLTPVGLSPNGGETQTVALESGSPAIDHGDPAICIATAGLGGIDQRGAPRPDVGETLCDIGAYEFQDEFQDTFSLIPFTSFNGTIDRDRAAGTFNLLSFFILGPGGSIDPTTQVVNFSAGNYSLTVPPGSFVNNSTGYVYQKMVNRGFIRLFIQFTNVPGSYQLLASGVDSILSNATVVVPVTLTIGDNSGSTQMSVTFN